MPQEQLDRLNALLAGRYAIERELAHGGMATVYLADDLRHRRKVALKVLRPELSSALGPDRFLREIEIAARLSHPHIVALYDSGAVDGELYYVMPYVRGESLRQKLEREKRLAVGEAIAIVRQASRALDYAHAQHLVHRDIKPENILLHEGEAMVADFGIAVAADSSHADRLTAMGTTLGSPYYMSPEQAAGETELDARSDVYSLACVLYELLAGEPPWMGASAAALIAKRFIEPPPAVRRRRAEVPANVEQALLRAMAREPSDRFDSCGAFAAALDAAGEATARPPSVAVLPFQNFSADPENEFFADGVTEDVIAQLAKIRSLKVISRSSVMRYKQREQGLREIGRALDVATLLEGSVRRAGDRVRIVAQLIDAETDEHLWAETYDRQLTDIFAIQTDVALQIATALEAELSPAERKRIDRKPTTSMQAYQLYLQGRIAYLRYTDEGLVQGIEGFRAAIALDPNFALAWTNVAQAYAEMIIQGGGLVPPAEAYARAREAVTRALAIDDELGEAHSALALLCVIHDFDWAHAEQEFKRALELSPGSADVNDHYGWLCASLERYDDALVFVRRAHELDPLAHRSDVASTLLRAGRYEEALAEALHAVALEPGYFRSHSTLGWAYIFLGRMAEGVASMEQAARLNPTSTQFLAQLGQAYAMAGRMEQAQDVRRRLEAMARERYVSPYHMAYVYTGLGDQERAMDYLEQAFDEGSGSMYGIKGSFLFTPLRDHPRFRALLARMNLA